MDDLILKEKKSIIAQLIDKSSVGETKFLVYAVLFTIGIDDVVSLYLKTRDSSLKKILDSHLSKRLEDKNLDLKPLFKKLLKQASKANYYTHQRIRKILSKFVTNLPLTYRKKYFNFFFSTGYVYDLTSALNMSGTVWNPQLGKLFIKEFLETGNNEYLEAVLKNGKIDPIVAQIEEIWKDDFLDNFQKNRMIRKIAPQNLVCLEFLKESEPDKYLYSLGVSNNQVSDDEAECLFNTLNKHQRSFGLWCLGKLGKWHLLKKHLDVYIPLATDLAE